MKAIVFDLDGVLTDTARLHALAWENMFNEFLSRRGEKPFIRGEDYRRYLDGMPREDGIRNFLQSRNIHLSGDEISVLGSRKNQLYLELLKSQGPGLIEESFSFVLRMFHQSVPMAVVSSSRNARMILKLTGLDKFINVLVDPAAGEKEELRGKPDPDYFLKACEVLGYPPEECMMVEDAISGIQAGREARFGKVIGIKVNHDILGMQELKNAGANEVVSSLWNISGLSDLLSLPDAFANFQDAIPGNKFFLFLDFDGTISEIVENPSEAKPLPGIKELVASLGEIVPVCIITGRDTEIIRNMIDLPHIYYAACHGFEITGPDNYHYQLAEAFKLIPEFDRAEEFLSERLTLIDGIVIERKKFGLAFHYRKIPDEKQVNEIISSVEDYCKTHSHFKIRPGEEVIEILPNLDWDKGKSLLKLYDVLKLSKESFPPLYLGDGKTDEDAFREMLTWGIPILVGNARPTLARLRLNGPHEARHFLEKLQQTMEERSGRMESFI